MSTLGELTASRQERVRSRLRELERQLDQAGTDSLDFSFWNCILETVEALPLDEERAWKQQRLAQLRAAVRSTADALGEKEPP